MIFYLKCAAYKSTYLLTYLLTYLQCRVSVSSAQPALVYTDRRNRLLPERAEMLLFVKHNLNI